MKRVRLSGTRGKSFRNVFEERIWVDELREIIGRMGVIVGAKTSEQAQTSLAGGERDAEAQTGLKLKHLSMWQYYINI